MDLRPGNVGTVVESSQDDAFGQFPHLDFETALIMSPRAVPEPSSVALVAVGLFGAGVYRLRRQRA